MGRFTPWLLIIATAALVYFSARLDWLQRLDRIYYDFLISNSTLDASEDSVVVAIDNEALAKLGAWPWDRRTHAKLLDRLGSARFVVFDIIFSEPQSDAFGAAGHSSDRAFARAIASHGRVLLPVYLNPNPSGFFPQEVLPIPELADAALSLGHIQLQYDDDGIARSVFLAQGVGDAYWPHISEATRRELQAVQSAVVPLRAIDGGNVPANVADPSLIVQQDRINLRFLEPNSIPNVSYADVLEGRIPDYIWRDKIVFVGATAEGLGDYVPTPTGLLPGVEFNINILESLRQQGAITLLARDARALLMLLAFLCSAFVLIRLPPRGFLFATIGLAFGSLLVAAASLLFASLWVPLSPYLFGLALLYPLWSWRRIEIALRFLLDQLNDLEHASIAVPEANGVASLQRQLYGLQATALLDDFELVRISERGKFNEKQVRATVVEGQDYAMHALLADGVYQLSVKSSLPAEQLQRILQGAVYGGFIERTTEAGSLELVEKTIQKIKSTQAQVQAVRQRTNRSLARLQDAVIITDASGRIIFFNIAASKLFPAIEADKSIAELDKSVAGHVWLSILYSLFSRETAVYEELDLGGESIVLCQASWLGDAEEREAVVDGVDDYLLFAFTDVTSLRAAEQSKNEALAFLSHDMRSPIVSQLATIESVRQSATAEQQDLELLERLEQFGRKSLKYAEDFLQLSRAENLDKRAFYLVDVHGVVDGAVSQQQGFALQRQVALKVLRVDEDVWTYGDTELLERAISNLVSNAVQHSEAGTTVDVALSCEGQVVIAVIDRGAGIAEDAMPKLFEPYFRAKSRRSDDRQQFGVQSYGLGLSFVRTVVNRHGGQLNVNSEVGSGTEFKIILPLAHPPLDDQ